MSQLCLFSKEIQGYRGSGEDRGGGGRGARKKVCRGDGGDAREEDEICEGTIITRCVEANK